MGALIVVFLIIVPVLLGAGWFFQKSWAWWFLWSLVCGAELLWLGSEMKNDYLGIIRTLLVIHTFPAVSGGIVQALRLAISDKEARKATEGAA